MAAVNYGNLPFREQIRFFRRKLNLPTRAWTDIYGAEHDHAFVVAGANRDDLVADFRAAIDKAIAEGTTLEEFRKDFDQIVAKYGWSYNGGRNWRSRVIYDTNLRSSYSAGRYQQMQALKQTRPYVEFHHTPVAHPRAQHVAWDGMILAADDPWVKAHWTPLGWGCQCVWYSRSERDLRRRGKDGPDEAPPIEWEMKTIGTRGPTPRTVRVPKGVDPGFGHPPGASVGQTAIRHYMDDHAPALPPQIAAQGVLSTLSRERLLAALEADYQTWLDGIRAGAQAKGEFRVIGAIRPTTLEALLERGREPNTAGIIVRDEDVLHLEREAKRKRRTRTGKPQFLTRTDVERLPRILAAPRAVLFDTADPALIYVFDSTGARAGKLVVRIDFATKVRDTKGKRVKDLFNIVRSGGQVDLSNLRDRARYEVLEGKL